MNGDDFKRLDDKMKLANLQIDKRLAMIEEEISILQGKLRNVTEEVVALKSSHKAQQAPSITASDMADFADQLKHLREVTEEMAEMKPVQAVPDISELMGQFRELKSAFNDMREKFLAMPTADLKPTIDALSQRVASLERQIVASSPMVLE